MNWDYIAGFFDGEGTVSIIRNLDKKRGRIFIVQQRPEVLYDIQSFLSSMGINSHIYKSRRARDHLFSLQIADRRSLKLFLLGVREKTIVKKNDVEEALKLDYSKKWTPLSPQEVEQIIKLRKEGLSTRKIGSIIGRDPSNIAKLLKRLKVDRL